MLRKMIESQHIDSSPLRQMSVVLGWLKIIARSVSHMIICSKLPTVFKMRQMFNDLKYQNADTG